MGHRQCRAILIIYTALHVTGVGQKVILLPEKNKKTDKQTDSVKWYDALLSIIKRDHSTCVD